MFSDAGIFRAGKRTMRIGIDTGGTFTDFVFFDGENILR